MAPTNKLSDVRSMMERGDDGVSGPIDCFVTNFGSQLPADRRYTYRGCVFIKPGGLMCGRSIENDEDTWCKHNPSAHGNNVPLFRFDVTLVDANHGGAPLRACIFREARKLLEISSADFAEMEVDRQAAYLHAIAMGNPKVKVWIHTYPDGRAIIQKLQKATSFESPPGSPGSPVYFSPVSETKFYTPRSSRGAGAGVGSSHNRVIRSSGESRGNGRPEVESRRLDDPNLQRSLADVMELLASLKTPGK